MSGQITGAGYLHQDTQAVAQKVGQQVRDRSPIEQAMDEIDQAIEQLTYEINETAMRMVPVSRPQGANGLGSSSPNGNIKPDIAQPSPVEERLRALAQRTRNLTNIVSANRNALAI